MVKEHLQKLFQSEHAGLAINQRDVVDSERILQWRVFVELDQNGFRVEAILHFHNEAHPVMAVRQVLNSCDALNLLVIDCILELLNHLLWANQVGEFSEDYALLTGSDVFNMCGRASLEYATTRFIGCSNAI